MKKVHRARFLEQFLFVMFLLAAIPVYSQPARGTWSIKPEIGVNTTRLVDVDRKILLKNSCLGAVAGVEAEYQAASRVSLSIGALFSFQQVKAEEEIELVASIDRENYDKFRMGYINVPLMANVYLWKGLSAKAGVQVGYAVFADVHQKEYRWVRTVTRDFEEGFIDVSDRIHRLDVSVPVGLSYEYKNFVIDARYHIGLTPVIKASSLIYVFDCRYDDNAKKRMLQVTLGYKFHL